MFDLKKNKKGFTLIELLAVIVILSVLILIALPSVLNIMNKARRDAFKDEVASIASAAENAYAVSDVSSSCKISFDQLQKYNYIDEKSGYSGYISFDENGTISEIKIKNSNNKYLASGNNKNDISVDTNAGSNDGNDPTDGLCTLKNLTS